MDRRLEELVHGSARAQHGLVTRKQLLLDGVTADQIKGKLRRGEWQVVWPGVYGLPGRPSGWPARVMGSVLVAGEGAAASHRAAASLLDLPNVVRRLDITVPAGRRVQVEGLIVHRSRRLEPEDLKPILGIPATSPARTIVDMASLLERAGLTAILDDAAARRLLTRRDLVEALARAQPGRQFAAGLKLVQELLDERPADRRPLGSRQERRLLEAIRAAGLPEPEIQRKVVLANGEVRYVDYAWDPPLYGVELISFRWHGDLESHARDAEREAELVALGWAIQRTTAHSVEYELPRVIGQIARGLAVRGIVPATLQRRGTSQAV
jgi:very-short-patch-repair endonuclease